MAVERHHVNATSVQQTAPREFIVTNACDGGKTVQMVYTEHMAALLVEKLKDASKEEEPFG